MFKHKEIKKKISVMIREDPRLTCDMETINILKGEA